MPTRHSLRLAGLALGMAAAWPAWSDSTVHSLDQARGAIQSADGRRAFDREMSGVAADGFGSKLPPGFTPAMLVAQLASGADAEQLVLAGAKPWPQRRGSFVAMACLADTPASAQQQRRSSSPSPSCDQANDAKHPNKLYLGVFDAVGSDGVTLVARTPGPVDTQVDWSHTDLDMPQSLDTDNGGKGMPDSWQRFDLAAYKLSDTDTAFGVRAGWSEGYAGGGASFEALYLFQIDGENLRVIFAQPMMFSKMLAGDWHKDGTRDHEMSDASKSLAILKSTHNGLHDLRLRGAGDKTGTTYQWSPKDQTYTEQ
jgi:hypothetical protein